MNLHTQQQIGSHVCGCVFTNPATQTISVNVDATYYTLSLMRMFLFLVLHLAFGLVQSQGEFMQLAVYYTAGLKSAELIAKNGGK